MCLQRRILFIHVLCFLLSMLEMYIVLIAWFSFSTELPLIDIYFIQIEFLSSWFKISTYCFFILTTQPTQV